jgi:hypothetical protein
MVVLSLAEARALFVSCRAERRSQLSSFPDVVHHSWYSEYTKDGVTYMSVYYRPDYDKDVTITK